MKCIPFASSHRILSSLVLLGTCMWTSCASTGVRIAGTDLVVSSSTAQETQGNPSLPPGTSIPGADAKDGTRAASRPRSRTSIQLYFGSRHFGDGSLWGPVEDQFVFGSEFDWIAPESILGFEIGVQASATSKEETVGVQKIEFSGGATEIYLGARLDMPLFDSPVHLIAGAGPSLLSARLSREVNGSVRSGSSGSGGLYGHLGVMVDLGTIGLGLDYRVRGGADVEGFEDVFGSRVTGDANYSQLALTVSLLF